MRYAEVAVDAPIGLSRTFSYRVPDQISVEPGQLVWLPLGRRVVQGIVVELTATPRVEITRDILQPVEPSPVMDPTSLELGRWLSLYYRSLLFDTLALFLPPGFKSAARSRVIASKGAGGNLNAIRPQTKQALERLARHPFLTQPQFLTSLGPGAERELARLVKGGLVLRKLEMPRPRMAPRYQGYLLPVAGKASFAGPVLRGRQVQLLEAVRSGEEPYPLSQANKEFGTGVAEALVEKGFLAVDWVRVAADSPVMGATDSRLPLTLTPEQAAGLDQIIQALDDLELSPRSFLIHGVTGSGKTEVYLQAIQHALERGGQAVFLVPEIALTPQTLQRVNARFPKRVAVIHSQLTERQRFDQWWGIRDGAYDIVVGPRSALFAPLPRLRLIVIDEEHEWTYKQQDAQPMYDTRTVALKLSQITSVPVVLGTATPSVESYYQALQGRHRLIELPLRIRETEIPPDPPFSKAETAGSPQSGLTPQISMGRTQGFPPTSPKTRTSPHLTEGNPPSPSLLGVGQWGFPSSAGGGLAQAEICDMRRELREGNRSIFSRKLCQQLRDCMAQGQQAILFLNRRGSAPFVQCRDCGYVMSCANCSVSLTYHSTEGRLLCHRCNARSRVPHNCPGCGGQRIRHLGIGTQRVVDEVAALFPGTKISRWDSDAARSGVGHQEAMAQLAGGQVQVVVGTQMVAKGLHVPSVTLVGVILADVGIHLPDFRAGERTFGLLCQVAGRAGRGIVPGHVIIQTYHPEHYAIVAAGAQDYAAFYSDEIEFRRRQGDPPFSQLVHLIYQDPDLNACQQQATGMARRLRGKVSTHGLTDVEVIGPAPGTPERLRGRHRWHMVLRGRNLTAFLEEVKFPQGWTVDVDPVSLL